MKNLGKADRIIRTILGAGLVILAVILMITVGKFWWLGLIGVVLLGTAAVSICPLYLPFGISTMGKKKD